MASDPYGIDLLLTNDGDLAVTPAGDVALISGPLCCGQALISRFRVFPGELPLQQDYGSALARQIGQKSGDPTLIVSAINSELRTVIEDDPRFLSASKIAAIQNPNDDNQVAVRVEFVLAGGDRLETSDVAGAASLDTFDAQPELADSLSSDDLAALAGANSDEDDEADQVPDLDEFLEGQDDLLG